MLDQWLKSNAKFTPPVIMKEESLVKKIQRLWEKVEKVAWGKDKKGEKKRLEDQLDRLMDLTICPHNILLCEDPQSGCQDPKLCKIKAHIWCSCPLPIKIPSLDLLWLYHCATASLRYNISSAAAAAVATGFIQDLIDSGHL